MNASTPILVAYGRITRTQYSAAVVSAAPNPDCRACNGSGTYYEDVAGDGGSRMPQTCDCQGQNPVVRVEVARVA